MDEDTGPTIATLRLHDWTGRLWFIDSDLPENVKWGVRLWGGSLALQRSNEGDYELFRIRNNGPWEKLHISASFQEMHSQFQE